MFGRVHKKHRILLLGPQSAGKTTIMYRLAQQPVPESMVPTAVHTLEKPVESPDGHRFVISEQKTETPDASAIVFVITQPEIEAGISDLKYFINHSLKQEIPLLVLINKQDLSETASLDEVCAELTPLVGTGRSWAVWACSGLTNTGLTDAVHWLETKLPIS